MSEKGLYYVSFLENLRVNRYSLTGKPVDKETLSKAYTRLVRHYAKNRDIGFGMLDGFKIYLIKGVMVTTPLRNDVQIDPAIPRIRISSEGLGNIDWVVKDLNLPFDIGKNEDRRYIIRGVKGYNSYEEEQGLMLREEKEEERKD